MPNNLRLSLLAFGSAFLLSACIPGTAVMVTPGPDVTPPTVLSTSPVDSAVGVARNAVITATFSEAMDATTITDVSFTVDNGVTGTVTYSGNQATFTPSTNLSSATTYTATISAGVMDTAGNAMTTDKVWTFTSQGWASKTAIPTTSYGMGAAVVDGKLYAISGFATTRVGIYDPLLNSWSTGTSVGGLRQYFGTAVIGDTIYVVGGDTGGGGDLNTLLSYDTVLNTWTTLAPMPMGSRYGLGAVAIDGKIYAVGGYNINGATYLNRLEVYDPGTGMWTTLTSMPTARVSPLVGVINGKLLVAGGSNSGGVTSVLEVYNPVTDSWSTGSSMPYSGGFDGAVIGNKLYAIGGGATPYNRVFAYDATKNAWTANFDTMPTGRWAIGVAGDEANNKIYAVGGWNGAYSSALEVFSPPVP